MTRRIETVEWGVETDDLGSTDIFETETEARAALTDGGTLVRITTTVERDPSTTVDTPHERRGCELTAKQGRKVGKWFAPPSGGYNGLGPNGEVVTRKGNPPKIPATAAGVRKQQEEQRSAGTASRS